PGLSFLIVLDDLNKKDLKRFALFLSHRPELAIPKGNLESMDPSDIAEQIIERYSDQALKVTKDILRKMGLNNKLQKRKNLRRTAKKNTGKYRVHCIE
uniref:Pyrin domain-containing protein n=1 Tax=Denticeps clupeoides TaxID=299321 RepID=A0A8C4BGR2_9TELE